MLRWKLKKADLNYTETTRTAKYRTRNFAYIALGSNKGNRIDFLRRVIDKLNQNSKVEITKLSSIYETRAYGKVDQPNFLNAVIEVVTSYKLIELFNYLKSLEKELGRTNDVKWGPREIDLDLLFYNDEVFINDEVTVPHYGIQDRDFVLVPLNELAPSFFHPALKLKISDICNSNIPSYIIRKSKLKLIEN